MAIIQLNLEEYQSGERVLFVKMFFCELWLFEEAFQAFLVVKAATDLLSYFAWQMRWLWFEKKKDTFVSHLEIIVSLLKWLIEGTL